MPAVSFDALPDDARVWVFAAAAPVTAAGEAALLSAVDEFLGGWAAHGAPLRSARDWRDGRFLAVGVDQRAAGASGCSIDGLYRSLRGLEPGIGTSLLAGGRMYWRDDAGRVQGADRPAFRRAAADGAVGPATAVFDTTVTTAGAWRDAFERPLAESWHAVVAGLAPSTAFGAAG